MKVREHRALEGHLHRALAEGNSRITGVHKYRPDPADLVDLVRKCLAHVSDYRLLVVTMEDQLPDTVRQRADDAEPLEPEIVGQGL